MVFMTFRHSEIPRHISSQSPRHMAQAEPDADRMAALGQKAAAHADRNELPQAMASYQAALLIDDSCAELWCSYANLQRHMGLKDDAVESFEFALRNDPRLLAARFNLANLMFEMGRPLAAMEYYREVIRQSPDHMPAWRNLGKVHYACGDLPAAEACLREAMALAPLDHELPVLLGRVLREKEPAPQN